MGRNTEIANTSGNSPDAIIFNPQQGNIRIGGNEICVERNDERSQLTT